MKIVAFLFSYCCCITTFGQIICGTVELEKRLNDSTYVSPLDTLLPETIASYPGGKDSLMTFIKRNLNVPEIFNDSLPSQSVKLKFLIDETGTITKVWVIKKIPECSECAEEAVRVIKLLPKWIPGTRNNIPVPTYFYLPVRFGEKPKLSKNE